MDFISDLGAWEWFGPLNMIATGTAIAALITNSTAQDFMTIPHLDFDKVAQLLPFKELIDHFEVRIDQDIIAPIRSHVRGDGGKELLVMPALADNFGGVKIVTVMPDNADTSRAVIGGLFVLLDGYNGDTLATFNGGELTMRRTAAISALAARYLASVSAENLLIVGSGHLAPYLAEAHATVRKIRHVAVWARDLNKAADCASRIRQRLPDMYVTVENNLEDAVRANDIISCATRATEPLIRGSWLSEGTHVDLVGGYRPDMREIDDEGILRSEVFVDDLGAVLVEAGDLMSPIRRSIIAPEHIRGNLRQLIKVDSGAVGAKITLFKSVGSGAADLLAAEFAWQMFDGSI